MRVLVAGALLGTALGWIFRKQLRAAVEEGADAAARAAGAARDAVGGVAEAARGVTGQASEPPLEELTKEQLYERARALDIPGRSEMSKDELIAALRARG